MCRGGLERRGKQETKYLKELEAIAESGVTQVGGGATAAGLRCCAGLAGGGWDGGATQVGRRWVEALHCWCQMCWLEAVVESGVIKVWGRCGGPSVWGVQARCAGWRQVF